MKIKKNLKMNKIKFHVNFKKIKNRLLIINKLIKNTIKMNKYKIKSKKYNK
jgi:hypothetical protein